MLIHPSSLGVAALLSLTTLTSARISISHGHIRQPDHSLHRRQSIPATLPGNWTSKGCFTDNVATRTLTGPTFTDTVNMTIENCIAFCDKANFIFAGVEFSQECYCDNFIENGGTFAQDQSGCADPCTGDAAEVCGGADFLNLFFSGGTPPPAPSAPAFIGLWESLGCFTDNTAARTLAVPTNTVGDVTIDSCTAACFASGFPLSGVEFADQCFCGLEFDNGGVPSNDTLCDMVCQGNSTELCGGANRLNVYNYTGTNLPPVTAPPPPGGGGNPAVPVFPVTAGLPGGFEYKGCFVDNTFGRILGNEQTDNSNLTVESCVEACIGLNTTVVGVEFSVQCFCGDTLLDAATIAGADTDCDMGCGGNSTEACGGPNRMSIYSTVPGNVTILPVPVAQNTSLPGKWSFQGCIVDHLGNGETRIFANQLILPNNNSATNCLNACATFGYPAAGMEFGDECWCGDISDITTNNGTAAPETDCSFPCSGDAIHLCGGAERLQLYTWDQSDPLVDFHTPEVTGEYDLLIGGIVIPLIASIGVNNKVQFLEKFGTSDPPNSTGAYELDLSLTDDFFHAWRELHVKSDVFCSGSLILPDKAGRQLNVGGWSLDSTFGVRLYTPDGSPGVNGTNDWEEDNTILRLQNGRWYPGVMVMANGSVLVVGGESGSNAPPVPTVEILPTPAGGPTFLFQDWLNRTDPFNLYPFLFVLPQGGVLVLYYNEARILDETTLQTDRVLPNMPGSLSDFTAGRTYPMEGTAVIMPQHAPYTDPLTVLVCGGATILGEALDNCVSIQPEVPGANWTIERMPSKRVMTCIAALPDGTYMVMNGAQQGHAGFGLAVDPNFQATLYDPTQPIGSRFSILNSTIVARMYHSEAILMPDGRVLVTGSDPEDPRFPQEFRMEVYTPPYLSNNLIQPNFTVAETDWAYGGQYKITVNLFQGTTDTMRVSLMGAVSSTHGNSFGSRTFFPEFSCSGNECTVTAPPNAHVSPPGWFQVFVLDGPTPSHSNWVRIGGDPSSLGNWPNAPGFTLPGV